MRTFLALAVLVALSGCVSAEELAAPAPSAPSASASAPRRDADRVASVQFFAGRDETALPVMRLGAQESLTLAFDLVGSEPSPVSVWYYLADRTGRVHPFSSTHVQGFKRLDVLDGRPSAGTKVRYVHYRAALPDAGVQLTVSGRYLVRVTELGREDALLFERSFYVAESGVEATVEGEDVYLGGATTSLLPRVTVSTEGLVPDPFYFSACFAQDGHTQALRCADRALVAARASMTFQLPPDMAFARDNATHFLDLTSLRSSPDVERVDLQEAVPLVRLAPDQPAFPDLAFPSLMAQPVFERVRALGPPETSAEYVDVTFQMTPPGDVPLADAFLTGAFTGWRARAVPLAWNAETRRYTATVRLKQGQYEYRYQSSDPRFQRLVAGAPARAQSRYHAFVYYRDPRANLDRLLAVRVLDAL